VDLGETRDFLIAPPVWIGCPAGKARHPTLNRIQNRLLLVADPSTGAASLLTPTRDVSVGSPPSDTLRLEPRT